MAKRSLKASVEGIRKAKQAFKRKGFTQQNLATEVGLETRQPIWKFFTGKPVDRQVFHEICFVLELNAEEIFSDPGYKNEKDEKIEITQQNILKFSGDIDKLVKKVRTARYDKVQDQCSTLNLLDVSQAVALDDLYIDVNISEEIFSQRWVSIGDLQKLKVDGCDSLPGMRLNFSQVSQKQLNSLDVVKKYSRLMILGKPGSGKTTCLQSIAIRCNQGLFGLDYVPVFVRLKYFTEDRNKGEKLSLTDYLIQEFTDCGISELELIQILTHGKALILFDGLDEVNEEFSDSLIQEIRYFAERFYHTRIIITCRIAALQYKFKGFNEVEICDFNQAQIAKFVERWFLKVANQIPEEGIKKASQFMGQLELPGNEQIKELAKTPILLNLTCLVFQSAGNLLIQRSELYKQGLELLLIRWDEARGIKRDEVYRNLSLLHKLKLLSSIASITFTQKEYFFSASKIKRLIANYLRDFPQAPTDMDLLQLESEAVLKSIEAQHGLLVERARGIYSFSHLTFQEYLTAREIITQSNHQDTLQKLISYTNEKRWREVFLLASQMLQPADDLPIGMQGNIHRLLSGHRKLQDFLSWVFKKSSDVKVSYNIAAVRAFYFTLALPLNHPLAGNQSLALSLDKRFAQKLPLDLGLDMALSHALSVSLSITPEIFFQRFSAISLALDLEHLLEDKPNLQKLLQQLKSQLPLPREGKEVLISWWQEHGQEWTEELRNIFIGTNVLPSEEVRLIGYKWEFDRQESLLLQEYWDSTKLLVDCLKNTIDISPELRSSIEKNLFVSSTLEQSMNEYRNKHSEVLQG
ncbi:MAG: NACHT domain-containing NTPase [Cyanobacteria bacterium P01_A01_bin.84]